MKLIDKNGKVLGKINIIDLLFLVGVIVLIVGLIIGAIVRGVANSKPVKDKVKFDIKVEETARIEKEFEDKRAAINDLQSKMEQKLEEYNHWIEAQKTWQNGYQEGLKVGYIEGYKAGSEK